MLETWPGEEAEAAAAAAGELRTAMAIRYHHITILGRIQGVFGS